MEKHQFNLVSGIPCEITELTGNHQDMITAGGDMSNHRSKLDKVLASIIQRLGSKTSVDIDDVKAMLSADKKKALFMARQFSMDFDPTFVFNYKWIDGEGKGQETEMEVSIGDNDYTERPFHDADGNVVTWNEVSEVEKNQYLELKGIGKVRYTMLDGYGELKGASIPKKDKGVTTALTMRNLVSFRKDKNGKDMALVLDPKKLSLKHSKQLWEHIKSHEGDFGTEVMIEDPKTGSAQPIDVLDQPAFFFPSLT